MALRAFGDNPGHLGQAIGVELCSIQFRFSGRMRVMAGVALLHRLISGWMVGQYVFVDYVREELESNQKWNI